jgi:pyrimidine oxygenase
MGLWPGDEYFAHRYDYAAEYVQIMRELWATGVSNFKGRFFTMNDCRLSPRPQADMKLICAGQSDSGMAFTAKYADYNFCFGMGFNTPTACAPTVQRMQAMAAKTGRTIGNYGLFMVITGETDAEALAKWELYKDGADLEALHWLTRQGAADTKSGKDTNVRHMADAKSAVNLNIGLIVGSHATCARLLDEVATIPGLAGVLLTFDEFVSGTEIFGERIQPLMQCRRHVPSAAKVAA